MSVAGNNKILSALADLYPDAKVTVAIQPLSTVDYEAQKYKHFSRRALGGAIGIIRNSSGRIVLVERSGMHAGWALPGGTVEEGEDFEIAFRREITEETGIFLEKTRLVEIEQKTFTSPQGEGFDFILAVFTARMQEDELPGETEDAIAEGLNVALFDPAAVPSQMILGDREKIARHAV
ncbi:MAG: NUDIX domain-containing protein [Rhizobiaceae bacterium]|nr:NUDIX domain-containing protein [Rhizobiaceae bacterium]